MLEQAQLYAKQLSDFSKSLQSLAEIPLAPAKFYSFAAEHFGMMSNYINREQFPLHLPLIEIGNWFKLGRFNCQRER